MRNFVYKHDYRSKTRQLRKVGHGTTGLEHFQEQVTPGGWFMEHLMVIKVGYSPVLRNRNSSFLVKRNLTRLQTQNDFQTKWNWAGSSLALGKQRQEDPQACWPASHPKWVSCRSQRGSLSKMKSLASEEQNQGWLLASLQPLCTHTHVQLHT